MTRVNPIAISGESSRQEEAFDQTEPIDVDSPKDNADGVGDDPVEEEQ